MKPRFLLKKRTTAKLKVNQGDIYSSITFFRNIEIVSGRLDYNAVEFANILVLSQTCDLTRESEESGSILSVLVVPMFPLEEYLQGTHLSKLGIAENPSSKKLIDKYKNKEHNRYRVLEFSQEDKIKYYLEDSFIIDFRYFFTVDIKQFKRKNYKASLNELFREEITSSFSDYLSRIGLPDIKRITK